MISLDAIAAACSADGTLGGIRALHVGEHRVAVATMPAVEGGSGSAVLFAVRDAPGDFEAIDNANVRDAVTERATPAGTSTIARLAAWAAEGRKEGRCELCHGEWCDRCDGEGNLGGAHRPGFVGVAYLDRELLRRALALLPQNARVRVGTTQDRLILDGEGWRCVVCGLRGGDTTAPRFTMEEG